MPLTLPTRRWQGLAGLASAALACNAAAHETGGGPVAPWPSDAPLWALQLLFAVAWGGYLFGAARARPPWRRAGLFHASLLLAAGVLFGPLDTWAAQSAAWHMAQHMLLIALVAPLLVLARPLATWRGAIGPAADRLWRPLARASRRPMACALLHAVAVWFWHAPVPYVAALGNTGLHVLEHASFLFTAWLFWWSVLRPGRAGLLQAALALLFTATHTGMLGALLTFAPVPLYGQAQGGLAGQQLAGLLMWVPGGILYLGAAMVAGFRWLAGLEQRSGLRGASAAGAPARSA